MVRYDPIQMKEVSESDESGLQGDEPSSKRKRPAPSEHGSDGSSSKRQRFESDVVAEQRKYSKVMGDAPPFGERHGPDLWFVKTFGSISYTPLVSFEPGEIIEQKEVLEAAENDHRIRCQDALKHYRDTKGPDYELVEVVKRTDIPILPFKRFHYNFKAKKRAVNSGGGKAPVPKSPLFGVPSSRADDDDDDDGSPKLFYADLWEDDYGTYRLISVMQCEILDPSGPVGNCPYCENGVLHPTNLVDPDKPPFWMPVDPLPDYDFPFLLIPYDDTYQDRDLGNAPGVSLKGY